jgi:hypothetical protein
MSYPALKHGYARKGHVAVEHNIWRGIIQRCTNPKRKHFADYGGRGITICEHWQGEHGFENFLADMGLRPTPEHSVDRYPNVDGNYEPSNCRWATRSEQAKNRRPFTVSKQQNTSSTFFGVYWHKAAQKFSAMVNGGGPIHIGLFVSEEDAARAYDREVRKRGLLRNLNFPQENAA